jgi:hypothetical protein
MSYGPQVPAPLPVQIARAQAMNVVRPIAVLPSSRTCLSPRWMWQDAMSGCWALACGAGPLYKVPRPSASATTLARFLLYSIIDPLPQKADP